MRGDKIRKLNLGCDTDYRKGWVNLDKTYNLKADVKHDLDVFPYPFDDNEFDYILAQDVLEHLSNPLEVMKELWRIAKPKAIIEINVPYWNNHTAWVDITHKRPYTYDSFSSLCGFIYTGKSLRNGYLPKLFKYKYRKLNWGTSNKFGAKQVCGFMNWFVNLAPTFFERRFPFLITIENMRIKLEVLK